MSAPEQRTIKTTRTVFDIIESITRGNDSVTEIAEDLEMSKSTVYTHLLTLQQRGYLTKTGTEYQLGLQFLSLGGHVQTSGTYRKLYRTAKPEIDELANETAERAQLMVEEDGYGSYLYQSTGSKGVMTDTHVGTRVFLHATAVGKAFLAHVPEAQADRIIERHGLVQETENTTTDRDELFAELGTIRERGVAFDNGERVRGIRCVAAPIETDDGAVLGAISVSVPNRRITEARFEQELPELVSDAARVIGLNVTYS